MTLRINIELRVNGCTLNYFPDQNYNPPSFSICRNDFFHWGGGGAIVRAHAMPHAFAACHDN